MSICVFKREIQHNICFYPSLDWYHQLSDVIVFLIVGWQQPSSALSASAIFVGFFMVF